MDRNRGASGASENFTSEVKPRASAFVSDVDNAAGVLQDQIANGAGKIAGEGRRASLIVHYGKLRASLSGVENFLRERRTMNAKEPRGATNAPVGMVLLDGLFACGLRSAISVDGLDGVRGFVWASAITVENVVGTYKEDASVAIACGQGNIFRSGGVDRESQLGIFFAAVDIGVCRREHDPVWKDFLNKCVHLRGIAQVGFGGTCRDELVRLPFAK